MELPEASAVRRPPPRKKQTRTGDCLFCSIKEDKPGEKTQQQWSHRAITQPHNNRQQNSRPATRTQRRGCCAHPVKEMGTPRTAFRFWAPCCVLLPWCDFCCPISLPHFEKSTSLPASSGAQQHRQRQQQQGVYVNRKHASTRRSSKQWGKDFEALLDTSGMADRTGECRMEARRQAVRERRRPLQATRRQQHRVATVAVERGKRDHI